eukprot:TRINITY_DN22335_c0_g1_i3.p4 TRINITY_DN22335_c0_g1~~TRINITY_DN22335_c0_g1_i3.p4  ORF type:complete len:109 (-),score=26.88 TRINITY_DN22335_c0_g1_i3:96-422(-)
MCIRDSPVIAQENGIKGKVFVAFVVDENGDIYDVTLARGVDVSLDREALRVVKSMPRWKPGKQGNKAVKVRYTAVSYTHLRAHETSLHLVCRLLLEKKKKHKRVYYRQ